MENLKELISSLIDLREKGTAQITLLAVCPNSEAVLEAAVRSAQRNNAPMLFAATLNQVDTDGGYTGWTPDEFVRQMHSFAAQYNWDGPLYPCLDHGGPWLKDRHTLEKLSLAETMGRVKTSLEACLEAGYSLLHIDPTVDRSLPPEEILPVEIVVSRTVELIEHAENYRVRRGLPPVAYEVGSEEVHGGLVEYERFELFLTLLRGELVAHSLPSAWPSFIVAQVGTDLHTTTFDAEAAHRLHRLAPSGALVKGHYTDWVENPADYPTSGMGGANVGPEFTAEEYLALKDLVSAEASVCRNRGLQPSDFMLVMRQAVVASGRWRKWLQPDEIGRSFDELSAARIEWLLGTGARYIWTQAELLAARQVLYANLSRLIPDPHSLVVERIARAIDRYILAFNLFDSLSILG